MTPAGRSLRPLELHPHTVHAERVSPGLGGDRPVGTSSNSTATASHTERIDGGNGNDPLFGNMFGSRATAELTFDPLRPTCGTDPALRHGRWVAAAIGLLGMEAAGHITRSWAHGKRRPVRNSLYALSVGSWMVAGSNAAFTSHSRGTTSASG